MAHSASIPGSSTEAFTEERTEPFSPSELDSFLRSPEPHVAALRRATVPLDALQVDDSHQGIRLLVRDLTNSVSPRRDNSLRWVVLRADVASSEEPEHQVLAVTQTHKDIKFSVRIPGEQLERPPLWCELYYDPASDNQILVNRSDEPVTLAPFTTTSVASSTAFNAHVVNPNSYKALAPGTWRISVRGIPVLDFRILEKRPFTLTTATASASATGKRPFADDDDLDDSSPSRKGKKRKGTEAPAAAAAGSPDQQEGVVMFLRKAGDLLAFPQGGQGNNSHHYRRHKNNDDDNNDNDGKNKNKNKNKEDSTSDDEGESSGKHVSVVYTQPLLEISEDQTAHIPGDVKIGSYRVTKRDQIASSPLSTVYTAKHSTLQDCLITVKVLKTKVPANARPQESERNVIRQADMWLREYQNQDDLKHDSIVRLHGGDARFLSLYMEHIDAKDLGSRDEWRSPADHSFVGTRADAARVLYDISGALQYMHKRRLVHNDIKPNNILYSRDRGAMLCDFGLSSSTRNPLTGGGTPYYVPPEFIGLKQRGLPSDVWALGVVMLYLLRKITLPEARAHRQHPKQLYWMIAEVNRTPPSRVVPQQGAAAGQPMTARTAMMTWLSEISEAKEALDQADWLERIVIEMLVANPKQRTSMDRIRARFETDEGHRALEEDDVVVEEAATEVDVDTAVSTEVVVVA